jgi:hypothetical protein
MRALRNSFVTFLVRMIVPKICSLGLSMRHFVTGVRAVGRFSRIKNTGRAIMFPANCGLLATQRLWTGAPAAHRDTLSHLVR